MNRETFQEKYDLRELKNKTYYHHDIPEEFFVWDITEPLCVMSEVFKNNLFRNLRI